MKNWPVTSLYIDSLMKIFTESSLRQSQCVPCGFWMMLPSLHAVWLLQFGFSTVEMLYNCCELTFVTYCEGVGWRCMIFVGSYNLFTVILTEFKNVTKMKKTANSLLSIYVTGMVLSALHKVWFNPYINSIRYVLLFPFYRWGHWAQKCLSGQV